MRHKITEIPVRARCADHNLLHRRIRGVKAADSRRNEICHKPRTIVASVTNNEPKIVFDAAIFTIPFPVSLSLRREFSTVIRNPDKYRATITWQISNFR
jgi:hypothetical protein